MHLTINELLAYTDEERAKWEDWFATHGNDPLKFATPMDVHPTVSALILHCFWAELFYALWVRGEMLTEERMKKENEALATDDAFKIFAFGHSARAAMREFTNAATEGDWERTHEFEGRGIRIEGPARKLIAHILIHEIRHWAQVAVVVRQHDLVPPGEHDLLFSQSFGPLIRKL
jgi:uncharacterized damage-inducible protein DinB